jgi:hypothetical protein
LWTESVQVTAAKTNIRLFRTRFQCFQQLHGLLWDCQILENSGKATSATKPGTYDNWWIWDGEKDRFVGKLPKKLRSLEHKFVWGDERLEERIASGRNPFEEIQ